MSRSDRVSDMLHTSVDDCRSAIDHEHDIYVLFDLYDACIQLKHKSRAQVVRRRIAKLAGGKS